MGKYKKGARKTSNRKNMHVFDKLGKIIYQELSNTGIVNSLEGLFKTEISAGTKVVFAATESIREKDDRLEKRVSDFVLFAGTREFVLEFQIGDDKSIGQRLFGYGYAQGERHKVDISDIGDLTVYDFPEAAVVYLESTKDTPDTIRIGIRHNGMVVLVYEARVYKVLEHSLAELEVDKLYVLLPFYLMKPRRELQDRKPDAERRKELARDTAVLVEEIIAILERGVCTGVITEGDMIVLEEKMYLLYRELYGTIAEFKEAMMTFEDKFRSKIPALIRQTEQERDAKILSLWEQGKTLEEVKTMLAQEYAKVPDGPQPAMS